MTLERILLWVSAYLISVNFAAQKNIDAISHVVVFFSCSQFIVRFWMEKDIVKVWNMAHLDEAEIELKNKTNNGLERYNRHLNGIVSVSHPNP